MAKNKIGQTRATGARIPKIVKDQADAVVIINKMNNDKKNNDKVIDNSKFNFPDISKSVKEKIINNKNIIDLFPDIDISMQMMIPSILSPNDMMGASYIYNNPVHFIPADVKASMTNAITTYIETETDIYSNMPNIVKEALYTNGCYAEVIIPEASLDEIINSDAYENNVKNHTTLEGYIDTILATNTKGKKVLVPPTGKEKTAFTISVESYEKYGITHPPKKEAGIELDLSLEDLNITLTENIGILSSKENYLKAIATENMDIDKSTRNELDKLFSTVSTYVEKPYLEVKTAEETIRNSIGIPLRQKLPPESVIPVHVVGDPSKHIGYFILLDESGTPIVYDDMTEMTDYTKFATPQNNQAGQPINIIDKAKTALKGITEKDKELNNLPELYSEIVMKRIKEQLAQGKYGGIVNLNMNADIYRVMFARTLKNQKTRLLFVPEELLVYYAFDYRDNGTGKSTLEKLSTLASMRAILLFTKVMASVKNSTTTTEVEAKLDDDDPDPQATMERIVSEAFKTRQTQFPLGVTRTDDLAEWVHKLGFRFKFSGANIPDMDITSSDASTSKIVPDTELDDSLQEQMILAMGATPELVRSGFDSDFATTIVSKNILFARRVIKLQNTLSNLITKHVIKLITNDMRLQGLLKDILISNFTNIKQYIKKYMKKEISSDAEVDRILKNQDQAVDYIMNIYMSKLSITLPKPVVDESISLTDAYDKYVDTLDKYLELIFSDETFSNGLIGDFSDKIGDVKNIVKAMLVKKWMAENNYMPEVHDILTLGEENKPIYDVFADYSDFFNSVKSSYLPFLKKVTKIKNKVDEKLTKIAEDTEPEEEEIEEDTSSDDAPTDDVAMDDTGDDLDDDTTDDLDDTDGDLDLEEEPVDDGATDDPEAIDAEEADDDAADDLEDNEES